MTDDCAIQVCATLTPFNRERELEGVRRGCALPGKRRGGIITCDQRDALSVDGIAVDVVPAWEWLDAVS